MAKRGDIGKRRFLSVALAFAADRVRGEAPLDVPTAALRGMQRAYDEAQHGGMGIGPATARRANRECDAWTAEVARDLGSMIIEGRI